MSQLSVRTSTAQAPAKRISGAVKMGLRIVFFILIALVFLTPLYWMLTGSFKEMTNAYVIPPEFIPKNPVLTNYQKLFVSNPAIRWIFNSLVLSIAGAVLCMFATSLPGYVFSKRKFPGRTLLFSLILVAMLIPESANLVPLFIIVKNLGLLNTYAAAILPWIVWPFGVFLMKQYIDTIPSEILDAARIDGASEWRLYFNIILPLSTPVIATIGIFFFMAVWNDYLWQYLVLSDPNMMTLPVGLISLLQNNRGFVINFGILMAGGLVSALPLFVLFLIFQGQFTRGLTVGAVKG